MTIMRKGDNVFKIGDKAVYPGHGVGVIDAIESKQISGREHTFYILRILENGMTIMIPRDNIEAVRLREVIRKIDVSKVIHILKDRDVTVDNQTWNRRYREYMEKINTGSIYEIAEVLRDLHLLKADKELSFGERKIMDTAKNLLVKELAIARDVKESDILKEINTIFRS
jgi:CarD family transcriptional regulator